MKRTKTGILRLVVFAGVFLLLTAGWYVFRSTERHASNRQFHTLSQQVAIRLTDFARTRIRIMEALASGIGAGLIDTDSKFQERAADLYEKFPGFQAINRVNRDGFIDIAYPLPENQAAVGHSIAESVTSGPYYRTVQDRLDTVLSGRVDLFTGGSGFTAYVPVVQEDRMTGMILGVFNMERLVRTCLSDTLLDQYGLAVADSGQTLVEYSPPGIDLDRSNPTRLFLSLEDRQWDITVFRPVSPKITWGDGLFLFIVLLVSFSVSHLSARFVREQQRVILSEEHLRTTLDAIPDAFIVLDSHMKVLNYQAPRDWICCSGVDPAAGMTLDDLLGQGFEEKVGSLIETCWSQMEVQTRFATLEETEGHPEVEVRVVPYEEDTTLLILRNMTEQRQAENKLRRAEARYRGIFEASQDAILLTSVRGDILEVNQAGLNLLGVGNLEELKQHSMERFYRDPADRQRMISMLREAGSVRNMEVSLQSMDGTVIHALISVRLIRAGQAFGDDRLLGTIHDISRLKELQNQLLEAQKMESIGRLAGGIAHDFNNILSSVLGYASLMKSKISSDHPFYEYVETIERGAVRAGDLTARLLGFARRGQFSLEPLDANEIVEDTASLLRSTVDKAIEIKTELAENLLAVKGDRSQLHQVLMNLCVNARDAMQGMEGTLTIRTGMAELDDPEEPDFPEVQPGQFVWVTVSDSGTGMDEETISRIFEPFFSTKQDKGTGLGLAMAYGVVRNHGGFIRVKSRPDRGTTFTVFLPAVNVTVVDQNVEQDALRTTRRASGETVLFVDDEEDNRSLAREILEFNGFNVITASNGEEAVACYRERKSEINGVVMDLIMPRMGGQEALKLLRSENPDLPVMLISGFSEDGQVQKIVEKEKVLFLRKPFQLSELVKKVGQLVRRT